MGRAWVKRWKPSGRGEKGSLIEVLEVEPSASIEMIPWSLPPSKSHAIRWLALAAQSNQQVTFHNMQHAGEDVCSMRRCLVQMGVAITDLNAKGEALPNLPNVDLNPHPESVAWQVQGCGPNGLKPPISVLHAGNSGTALRLLMALCARFDVPIMLDGDASLRSRDYSSMIDTLHQFQVETSHGEDAEMLPLLLQGPWKCPEGLNINAEKSSQPTSAWLVASPALPSDLTLSLEGDAVSRRHASLTREMCESLGCDSLGQGILKPWEPVFSQTDLHVPADCSMLAFPMLASKVLGTSVDVAMLPQEEDSLGHEVLMHRAKDLGIHFDRNTISSIDAHESSTYDLRDANDLITPLSALLALSGGGEITGAAHAAYKETNRLKHTQTLLAAFGIKTTSIEGGLSIPGGQSLTSPEGLVETYHDHRMQMTAIVLAMGCDEKVVIEGANLHAVADPYAVQRWVDIGVEVKVALHQHW